MRRSARLLANRERDEHYAGFQDFEARRPQGNQPAARLHGAAGHRLCRGRAEKGRPADGRRRFGAAQPQPGDRRLQRRVLRLQQGRRAAGRSLLRRRRRAGGRLATAWEGSPDGLSVTFKLRDGVKWHDGKPFTSADVAFSALQVWKPLQNLGRVVFKDLEAVDTPDELTAVFRFAKPTPFQLIRNALPALTSVVPKHIYDGTDIADNPANNAPVGTGPFKFAEYKAGRILPAGAQRRLLGQGPALSRRDRLPGAARPRRGGRRAGGRGDPARRLLGRAARRPRPHLQGRRASRSSPRATRR